MSSVSELHENNQEETQKYGKLRIISKTLTYGHHEKCVCCVWGVKLGFKNPQWTNAMHLSAVEFAFS